jgi:hypothetical protein
LPKIFRFHSGCQRNASLCPENIGLRRHADETTKFRSTCRKGGIEAVVQLSLFRLFGFAAQRTRGSPEIGPNAVWKFAENRDFAQSATSQANIGFSIFAAMQ